MGKYKILLVDDETLILHTNSLFLRDKGYQVTTARNGRLAIDFLQTDVFDLVITDLVMYKIDGLEVLKKAKEINSETQVIILTGFGDMKSAIDALRNKADDYILKPCEPDEILFRVEQSIQKIKLSRKIKFYEKILPICCKCKNIRDDSGKEPGTGDWIRLEEYLSRHSKIDVSHGLCPNCSEKINTNLSLD